MEVIYMLKKAHEPCSVISNKKNVVNIILPRNNIFKIIIFTFPPKFTNF